MSDRVPDLWVEQLALGELDADKRAEVERRLAEEEGGGARLEAIRASNAKILSAMPTRVFVAAVEQRAAAAPGRRGLGWTAVAVTALAALLLVMVGVPAAIGPSGGVSDGARAKGSPAIQLHRMGETAPLLDGGSAEPGDRLQVSYTAAGAEFGAILSVDGRGTVTWHLPRDGRRSVRLRPGGAVPLDHSYELDDAPEFERFLFVTGPTDFALDEVEEQVRDWIASDRPDVQLEAPLRSTLFSVGKEVP